MATFLSNSAAGTETVNTAVLQGVIKHSILLSQLSTIFDTDEQEDDPASRGTSSSSWGVDVPKDQTSNVQKSINAQSIVEGHELSTRQSECPTVARNAPRKNKTVAVREAVAKTIREVSSDGLSNILSSAVDGNSDGSGSGRNQLEQSNTSGASQGNKSATINILDVLLSSTVTHNNVTRDGFTNFDTKAFSHTIVGVGASSESDTSSIGADVHRNSLGLSVHGGRGSHHDWPTNRLTHNRLALILLGNRLSHHGGTLHGLSVH